MLHLEHPVSSSAPADARPMRNRASRSNGKLLFRLPKLSHVATIFGIFAVAMPATAATVGSRQPATCGDWTFYNSPWATAGMKPGIDYADLTTFDPAKCPNGTVLSGQYPLAKPTGAGVYGFNLIAFKNYDTGLPGLPAGSVRIADAKAATLTYALSYYNAIGERNQLAEEYLRDDAGTKKIEVGYLTQYGPTTAAWIAADTQLGTYTDPYGKAWRAVQHVGPGIPYVTFSPPDGRDRPSGTLDFLGAERWLQAKGLVQPNWYRSGIGFGIESISGGWWMNVLSLSVDAR